MKFAEAALFRVAVSPTGKIRDGIMHGRADARFVRGVWLGMSKEYDGHLFATDTRVYTARTVKRVPDTEQKRADLVKSLQGTRWDRTPGGKTSQDSSSGNARCDTSIGQSERPSEDADERRSAKAQDLNPPAVPHVIRVPRAAGAEN